MKVHFSIECSTNKTEVITAANQKKKMMPAQEAAKDSIHVTCLERRKKVSDQDASGSCFVSDWLEEWLLTVLIVVLKEKQQNPQSFSSLNCVKMKFDGRFLFVW